MTAQAHVGAGPYALANPGLRAVIGVARADLTPQPNAPINNWAAGRERRAQAIAAPLTATVVAIRPTEATTNLPDVVLATLDLGWWRTTEAADAIRSSVADRLGIEVARVVVCLSHTHAGPAIDPVSDDANERADVVAYLAMVADRLADAAEGAVNNAQPALLEWTEGCCHLARNRDQWAPAEGRYVCGFEPAADADATLLVGRVTADDGRLTAVLVNYACHATTLGPDSDAISPNYVGVARSIVEAATAAPMAFFQGASGELAPRRQYTVGDNAVKANGSQLGYAVLAALAGMLPSGQRLEAGATVESGAPLGRWELVADDPSQQVDISAESMTMPPKAARAVEPGQGDVDAATERERASRAASIRAVADGDPTITATFCRLGDAVVVAHPGEAYSHLQRDLRAAFPDRPVVVVNLANGPHRGYLPPSTAYQDDVYQVAQTPLGRGSLERLRDVSIRALQQLLTDTAPAPD